MSYTYDPTAPLVILVDDTRSDIEINTISLERIDPDLQILSFSGGKAALEFLEENKDREWGASLMLLDLKMPVMNGFEVLENIMDKQLKRFPIVVMSSSGLPEDSSRSRQLGADGFSEKPISLKDNLTVFKSILEGYLYPQMERAGCQAG